MSHPLAGIVAVTATLVGASFAAASPDPQPQQEAFEQAIKEAEAKLSSAQDAAFQSAQLMAPTIYGGRHVLELIQGAEKAQGDSESALARYKKTGSKDDQAQHASLTELALEYGDQITQNLRSFDGNLQTLVTIEQDLDAAMKDAHQIAIKQLANGDGAPAVLPLRALGLELSVFLRRSLENLHTEVPALQADARCAGDITRDRLLWRYIVAATGDDADKATSAMAAWHQQLACLSYRQQRDLEATTVEYLERFIADYVGAAKLDSKQAAPFASVVRQMMVPVMLSFRDVNYARGDLKSYLSGNRRWALDWFVDHRSELRAAALNPLSLLNRIGAQAFDRHTGSMLVISSRCINLPKAMKNFRGEASTNFLTFTYDNEESCNPLAAIFSSIEIECPVARFVPVGSERHAADAYACDPGCDPGAPSQGFSQVVTADLRHPEFTPDLDPCTPGGGIAEDSSGGASLGGLVADRLGCFSGGLHGNVNPNRALSECMAALVPNRHPVNFNVEGPSGGSACMSPTEGEDGEASDAGADADEETDGDADGDLGPSGCPEEMSDADCGALEKTREDLRNSGYEYRASAEGHDIYEGTEGDYMVVDSRTGKIVATAPDEASLDESFDNVTGGGETENDDGANDSGAVDNDGGSTETGAGDASGNETGGGVRGIAAAIAGSLAFAEPLPAYMRHDPAEDFSQADGWIYGSGDEASSRRPGGGCTYGCHAPRGCTEDNPDCGGGCTSGDRQHNAYTDCIIDAQISQVAQSGYPEGTDPRLINLINVRPDAPGGDFGLLGSNFAVCIGAGGVGDACPGSGLMLCPQEDPNCGCGIDIDQLTVRADSCSEIQCADDQQPTIFNGRCSCQSTQGEPGQPAPDVSDNLGSGFGSDCPPVDPYCAGSQQAW